MLKWSWHSSQLFSKILWSTLKIRQGQAVSSENNIQPHQKAPVTVNFVHKNNCTSLYLVPQKTYCHACSLCLQQYAGQISPCSTFSSVLYFQVCIIYLYHSFLRGQWFIKRLPHGIFPVWHQYPIIMMCKHTFTSLSRDTAYYIMEWMKQVMTIS